MDLGQPCSSVGTVAFWLVATDPDNDPLTYGISGLNAYYFSVVSNTGEVKLASSLDFETLPDFTITVFVNDHHNIQVTKQMRVIVEDRNDNVPIFLNTGFSANISETLPVGSVVLSVLAKDSDTGLAGVVRYFIRKVIPSTADSINLFRILGNGSIVLNDSLSYNNKSAFYQLELSACDSGGLLNNKSVTQCSQPVFASISVIDKPDLDPRFVREFYSASVAEDAALDTSVLTVEAVDSDKGINDIVTYRITNSTRPGWFSITKDGVIIVSGSLDREELLQDNEEVQIQVTATEKNLNIYGQEAKVSMWVTVRVTDVNDHKPEFYNCSLPDCSFSPQEAQVNFIGCVDEHASARISIDDLTMVAYDPDQGENGTFLLSLVGSDAGAFNVSPVRAAGSVSVQVVVKNSELVDYEKKREMVVEVVATDSVSKDFSVANVTIYLRNINDHRPVFSQSVYELTVPENSSTGFVVTNSIQATDLDGDEWGPITYSLLTGNGEDLFAVDPNSGELTVKNGQLLDRERQAVYYLTLQATDGGNQSSTTTLKITLLDINDNPPVVQGSYNIFVPEEDGNVSVTIQAYDNDQPETNNSRLLFNLLPGPFSQNFSIDPDSGLLRNLGPLDREAIDPALEGRIVLTVRVADCGEPSLSTDVNVTITVEDINDNLPIFNQSSYKFFVRERDPGARVGTVKALDADQTAANNRISFSLSGTGANNFILQSKVLEQGWAEGGLWLLPDVGLDYETQNVFNLIVNAENPGPQVFSSTATANVTVEVLDVNDEPPTLNAASLQSISVAENGSEHGRVAQVIAHDVDSYALLRIELVDVICTKAGVDVGSVCHGWFTVNSSGVVYINQSEAIDYEACHLVTLVVRAHDLNTDPGFDAYSSNGNLLINIKDKNDNTPYFLPNNRTFVIIPELVLPDQQVASVQARDEDSEDNGIINFFILKADFVHNDGTTNTVQVFRIIKSVEAGLFTGSIELVTNLDSTIQGTYQVTVQAKDQPVMDPALETQTTLNIFTVDQSYRVRLQFSTDKEEVGANMEAIKAALIQATRTSVYVVRIQNIDSMARARVSSYMDAYFVFSNGSALTLTELNVMIRKDQDALKQLLNQGLVVVSSQEGQESDEPKLLTSVIIGLVVSLVLVLVIMTTTIVCLRKSYHRKLRAMKAGKEARKTPIETTTSTAAIPGTNVYNTDRANPVLDLPTKDLGLECHSSSDLDYHSLNSLDENSVDLDMDSKEFKRKDLPHNPPEPDPEPLTAVLSERSAGTGGQKKKKKEKKKLSFTNPGLDTTDL
ncbi:cadherin-related family member 2 isoform X2 [Arvicanthis niloticus]|uniref:cadherin-related family member 2 isoform X2 n=1 Tax=Arvicanthis niloticus TaxID=61156 RepID=UPI00402BB63F